MAATDEQRIVALRAVHEAIEAWIKVDVGDEAILMHAVVGAEVRPTIGDALYGFDYSTFPIDTTSPAAAIGVVERLRLALREEIGHGCHCGYADEGEDE